MDLNNCIILADKPIGWTSADVVNFLRKKLDIKKAGHAGTLDPKATGLLVICTGKLTKLMNTFLNLDKEYTGTIKLGFRTESYDSETNEEPVVENFSIDEKELMKVRDEFLGEILQIPPMHSAIKFKGKPLYKLARKGRTVERQPRNVTIQKFDVEVKNGNEVFFNIVCSKGTYIRSIANDLGEKLGVGGYLKALRRTRVGEFDLEELNKQTGEINYKLIER